VTEPGREPAWGVLRRAVRLLVVLALFLRLPGAMEWWLNPDERIYFSIATQPTLAGFWEGVVTNLGMTSARRVQVLVGGWRSDVVDQLLALEDSGVVTDHRMVPGLFAFLVDMERLNSGEGAPQAQ